MVEFIKKVVEQVRKFWKALSAGKKTAMIFTLITIVTGTAGVLFWVGDTAYEVLGTNLASEDATNIMRVLRDKKIPFKVEHDGKTIKIPTDAVFDLRLELATMGLPQSSVVGYEVFDKQTFGTTSFVQRINEKRAREGELMRTINNMKGIKRSRIHLAVPNKATFLEDQKRSTASVVLDVEPGVILTDKQINGIARLVSSSCEGMDLNDVTIVDANGKVLSKNTNDPLAGQIAAMLEYQQKMESEYEKRIEDILTKVVGEGKVVAKVAMDLDFTQQSETQTQYDQEGSAVKSQQKENQVMDGSRPVPTGAPGALANTPGGAELRTPEVKSNTQKVFETTNYAVPEKVVRSTKPLGSVKKMSVAVLVDGFYNKQTADGQQPVFQKWNEEKLAEFKTLVASTVGLDLKRGDSIEVKNMEFRKEDLENADAQIAAFERRKMLMNIMKYLVAGIAIVMFFMMAVRPFIKWLTDNTVENMESFLPKTIEELEKVTAEEERLEEVEEAVPVIMDKVDPEKVEGEMIKEKVVTLIEANPHKAAMILHEWIHGKKVSAAAAAATGGDKGKDGAPAGGGGGRKSA